MPQVIAIGSCSCSLFGGRWRRHDRIWQVGTCTGRLACLIINLRLQLLSGRNESTLDFLQLFLYSCPLQLERVRSLLEGLPASGVLLLLCVQQCLHGLQEISNFSMTFNFFLAMLKVCLSILRILNGEGSSFRGVSAGKVGVGTERCGCILRIQSERYSHGQQSSVLLA